MLLAVPLVREHRYRRGERRRGVGKTVFRELRVGTARRNGNVQRLDASALNSLPHTAMKRVCYEVKASRSDFLAELKHPLKRRIGMRYSNEFYFVTPAHLVDIAEIPAECEPVEAGVATADEWKGLIRRQAEFQLRSRQRRQRPPQLRRGHSLGEPSCRPGAPRTDPRGRDVSSVKIIS